MQTENVKACGVYQIRNCVNQKKYVGSTIQSFHKRWSSWRRDLKKQLGNAHLQAAWNKYGPDAFEFSILEVVADKAVILQAEQFWIDFLNPEYNFIRKAGANRTGTNSKLESRQKQSNSMKKRLQDPKLRAIYRKNAVEAQKKIDRTNVQAWNKGQRLDQPCACGQQVGRTKSGRYLKTCGDSKCIESLYQQGRSRNHRVGKRSDRPCPVCGQPRKECYLSDGRFSKYQKTCGSKACVQFLQQTGIRSTISMV